MTLTRRRFLTISAAALVVPGVADAQWRGRALGAEAMITLRGGAEKTGPALDAALDTIRRMEKLFSLHDPGSQLSTLNRNGRLRGAPEFAVLLDLADHMHRATNGLFDPTIQPVWAALAAGRDATGARRLVGWHHVVRRANWIAFRHPNMAMTLNGIAQGFATDRVRSALHAHGFEDVVVNIGEYAVGDRAAHIAVQDYRGSTLQSLNIQNACIATSSPSSLRFYTGESHIVSPIGLGHGTPWHTVSVVARSAAIADAASTAVSLASTKALASALVRQGVVQDVLLFDADGNHLALV